MEYRGLLGLTGQLASNYATGPPDDPLYNPILALDLARQGMELSREIPSLKGAVAWQLGRAHYRLGNWKECIETIEELYKDDPEGVHSVSMISSLGHGQLAAGRQGPGPSEV